MKILVPFKALGYPIFPIIPECATCAAMRFALISAVLTGALAGVAMHQFLGGVILGFAVGVCMVSGLYIIHAYPVETHRD